MPVCKPSLSMFLFIYIILPNHYHMFMLYTRHDKKNPLYLQFYIYMLKICIVDT